MGSLAVSENLRKQKKTPLWIEKKRLHTEFTDPWVLFDFSFILSRNEIFVFTWIFLHIYLHHSHRQSHTGRRRATRRGGRNTFSEGDEVCVSKTEQSLCWKNHLNNWSVSQWLVSFSMVLACAVQADCLSVNTSVPCELCCFKSLARGFISQTDISTEQETDDDSFFFVLFCFNGTHGFATARCLQLNAWVFFHDGMWLCYVYVCQTEENRGI